MSTSYISVTINGDYYYSNLYTVSSGVKNMQWLIEDHALPVLIKIGCTIKFHVTGL